MSECKKCNSKLVATGIQPGQQVRCANCSTISTFGVAEKVAADHLAWRSLYLGLASFVLMFLTGIPAIYYGVKSLLRMRIARTKPSDQTAAIAGVALGGCVGVLFWGLALIMIVSVAIVMSTRTEISDPAEISKACAEEFETQIPESCKPARYTSMLGIKEFYFDQRSPKNKDGKSKKQMSVLVLTAPKSPQTDGAFIANLKTHRLNRVPKEIQSTEPLEWDFCEQTVEVQKFIFAEKQPQSNSDEGVIVAIQYYAMIEQDGNRYAMSVVLDPSAVQIEESEVKQLFNITKLVPRKKTP